MVSSFGITVLDSRESKEINLYSDYTKNKLQVLTFAAITSSWISLQSWDLAYNVHHGLADRPRYSFSPAVNCAWMYEDGFTEKQWRFCLRLPHHKQTYVTRKPLGLQKQNKDI